MRYLFIAILFAANSLPVWAQTMSQSFGNNSVSVPGPTGFETIQLTGGNYFQKTDLVNNNDVMLPSYGLNDEGANNTFFSKDWVKGSVTTTDNQTYSEGLVFMFDKVGHQLYFKKADSATIMEADMSKVSLFSLVTDKQHIFIKGELVNKDFSGEIFEMLVLDEKKFSLLKSIINVYQQPSGSSAAKAMTQTETPGKYVDKPVYYMYANNSLQQIELKKKSFFKALGSDELKAEAYTQNHHDNFNEEYAVNLLTYLNQQ
jgi:hypothetical protein